MEVFLANINHLESVSILFDEYRVFYHQVSDIEAAKEFLKERFQNNDSVVFAANENREIIGFTQLYPSFSSVSMKRVWILNDLYVKESHRQKGVATLLMSAAQEYAKESGAVRLILATHISNTNAQKLYKTQGYIKDEEFYHYALRLQ
ncbi:acetyltransferase [Nostoc linckia z18]|jgi:ribosomal protein S18 acetylase RimI-like enzyme|uniref:Acetyltransferase n=2 Tax=Nostoc linckia TaxID=92942 RepID=A0A9Q5ZB77_NOSLI|nr:GNAT family N-acetyltransferase [Nostoc linckia]PHK42157.1 acetyltransferase [Nostoc linckia z15]PHK47288.1 acetyltransferase [Nostoc linckia z16]PHJ63104.1 acetyltransferase [Nostoc linckia z1]PHJ72286.1 acetyltransferase [Nostoc linckia z3]PHJ75726.1 acetyltransferase [Nostoc linckia z2]